MASVILNSGKISESLGYGFGLAGSVVAGIFKRGGDGRLSKSELDGLD